MQLTVLAGGIGAARFLRGLLLTAPDADITVIGNTADDLTLYGLRVCPDLDTVTYTLGGGNDEGQGWGRAGETWNALADLRTYAAETTGNAPAATAAETGKSGTTALTTHPNDAEPLVSTWFGLGDKDLGTHLFRTSMLDQGYTLSEVTALIAARWQLPIRLLPMTDERVETHITTEDVHAPDGRRRLHFQEYWVRHHAELPVADLAVHGIEQARPAPGVIEAVQEADLVVLPPSNPVVSLGPILSVPGVTDAVRRARAPVVGISPIIGGAPVRGMADKLLPAIGVETTAAGVARHFGARQYGGLLDGWLVDERDSVDASATEAAGICARALPLLMSDREATATIASAALELGGLR